jgi:hypothetical protein
MSNSPSQKVGMEIPMTVTPLMILSELCSGNNRNHSKEGQRTMRIREKVVARRWQETS